MYLKCGQTFFISFRWLTRKPTCMYLGNYIPGDKSDEFGSSHLPAIALGLGTDLSSVLSRSFMASVQELRFAAEGLSLFGLPNEVCILLSLASLR